MNQKKGSVLWRNTAATYSTIGPTPKTKKRITKQKRWAWQIHISFWRVHGVELSIMFGPFPFFAAHVWKTMCCDHYDHMLAKNS